MYYAWAIVIQMYHYEYLKQWNRLYFLLWFYLSELRGMECYFMIHVVDAIWYEYLYAYRYGAIFLTSSWFLLKLLNLNGCHLLFYDVHCVLLHRFVSVVLMRSEVATLFNRKAIICYHMSTWALYVSTSKEHHLKCDKFVILKCQAK